MQVLAELEEAALEVCEDACDGVSSLVLKSTIEFVGAGVS